MHTLGCDGCKAGWLIVECLSRGTKATNSEHPTWRWRVAARFEDLISLYEEDAAPVPDLAFIDIPIGLSDSDARACDVAARTYLGPSFGSSVFPTPTRATLNAASYPEANAANRAACGKGLSKQTYFILPKIREIDDFLEQRPKWRGRLREAHPEVAFAALNGAPLSYKKKTEQGFEERLDILKRLDPSASGLAADILEATRRKDVARDDVLDALCLALMPLGGTLKTLPEQPESDARGIAMEICYVQANPSEI